MITRRTLLALGAVGAVAGLTACTRKESTDMYLAVDSPEAAAAEAARKPGAVRQVGLAPAPGEIDLGGTTVSTWSYGGRIPGAEIRVKMGEQVKATVLNRLPADTSVHWHGVALRNGADGVPHVTQDPIAEGGQYTYQFTAAHPGTYWLHPHTGVQLDRGLHAPLIVEDPREPLQYDHEWIVILDDWLDGVDGTPDDKLAELSKGMGGGMMGGHDMMGMGGATSTLLGGDAGDVVYPFYLFNGRLLADPEVLQAKPGDRVRIRFINAGADTAFRVAVGGHTMTVTHTDGFPVSHVVTDALLIGMGERYDVLVTLGDGVFPVVAMAEGKNAVARGLIRTGGGAVPSVGVRLPELDRRIVAYRQMKADEGVRLADRDPARTLRLELTGGMMAYDWGFNGKTFDHSRIDHAVRTGERVAIDFVNTTTMWHPVHLHGHTFAVGDATGPRKDTAIVLPGQTLRALFDADNPGRWMIHCHNAYHAEAGMMTLLGYQR